jgi:hypothetical protein
VIPYIPKHRFVPSHLLDVPTAWREVAPVINDILRRFDVGRHFALEFGVDYGYSTSVLAHFFLLVQGIDTFMGDINAGDRGDGIYNQVAESMKAYPNVELFPMDYREWIKIDQSHHDLIHVDIVHNYEQTFECGEWAVQHAPIVLFHDTLAFVDVMRAVTDLAAKHNLNFYNVNEQHGLGILTERVPHE